MKRETKLAIYILAGLLFLSFLIMIFKPAQANHRHWHGYDITINNYFYETTEVTEVTEVTESSLTVAGGASQSDLLSISSSLLAGGAHQFDYSTTKWQLSLTGDFAISDWASDNEFSIGVGKRWGKDSWLPNALFHGAYTPVLDDDHITIGVT
ncbi:MAG: hypothetical protein OES26_09795, partial [Gammaproteobacteria bacterium]|nr:hypothetical protein [Gammaproteobacteria bacterium]